MDAWFAASCEMMWRLAGSRGDRRGVAGVVVDVCCRWRLDLVASVVMVIRTPSEGDGVVWGLMISGRMCG